MSEKKDILSGKKVLQIEDDLFFIDLIAAKLALSGCKVTPATDGETALAELKKSKPDIIILDLMLPGGMDGFAILEKIKSQPDSKDIPVLIVSNLSEAEDVERGIKLGAFKYLTKSQVTPAELVENVASVLAESKTE